MTRISVFASTHLPLAGFEAAEISDEVFERARKRSWYEPDVVLPSKNGVAIEVDTSREGLIDAAKKVAGLSGHSPDAVVLVEPVELVHSASSWCDQMVDASVEDFPVALFVAFVGKGHADGTFDLRTEGLGAFGLPEVEVEKSPRDGEFTLEAVCDASLLLMTTEALPADGDTVELSAGTFRLRTMPSLSGSGKTAYRMRIR